MKSVRRLAFGLLIAAIMPACGSNHNDKPPPTLAIAPTNLVATPATTARIDLTWTDTSGNEFEFRIERSDDGGATFSQIAVVPMDTQAYSDLGLLPNRAYSYRVTAWNSVGSSPYAGPASATTNALAWKSSYTGTGTPGFRGDHSAIYDSLGRRMILFGGQDDFFTPYDDVWALDLLPTTAAMTTPPVNYWTQLNPSGVPPNAPTARIGHSAIYDTQNNRMIVFGGQDSGGYLNDVYVLTLGAIPAWSAPAVQGAPPAGRLSHTAVYDAANQRMIVFGGNDASSEKADTFFLSLPLNPPFVWSSGPAATGLVKRTEHSAIYDALRQQMLIFGGLDNWLIPDGSVLNNETWSLGLVTPAWNQLLFPGTPSFRLGPVAVYDSANQRMVMFGGDTSGLPSSNSEVWSLRLDTPFSTWTFLNPVSGTPPSARYGHTAIYDGGRQRMVIYGGYDDSGFPSFEDTWLGDF